MMTQLTDSFLYDVEGARRRMNELGAAGEPFLFLIDFEQAAPLVVPLSAVDPEELRYDLGPWSNAPAGERSGGDHFYFQRLPLNFDRYRRAFDRVQAHLRAGNSFLVNLTFPTPVLTDLSLPDIFRRGEARYRLWWRDRFVFFSPETFVTIRDGRIASFPMKGTIDATLPGARARLLADPKEGAEHATIVDLIRNDLSLVARRVRLERYRYVEPLRTHRGELLQTSSHVAGDLPPDYPARIGDLLFRLLPAGSISGAPKRKTLEIIREAEGYTRGYYTGVAGIFDGRRLDSAVMIRFIEQTPAGLLFKSGGGVTAFSEAEAEYRELVEKVYLPFRVGELMERGRCRSKL